MLNSKNRFQSESEHDRTVQYHSFMLKFNVLSKFSEFLLMTAITIRYS
jgi:hypothetical protein